MGFSAKQVQALRRNLDGRHVRTREANGREPRTSRAGTRSRKPTGSLGLMAGTEKLLNPNACWPAKIAGPSSDLCRAGADHCARRQRDDHPRGSWHR